MIDAVKVLNEGNSINIQPKGTSMYPLFEEKKGDRLIVVPIADIGGTDGTKTGDILLYRSEFFGGLIVHRLIKKTADGFYFCGDNQQKVEGPVNPENIYGIVTEIIKKKKTISVKKMSYRIYSFIWVHTIGFRKIFRPPVTAVHSIFNKISKH